MVDLTRALNAYEYVIDTNQTLLFPGQGKARLSHTKQPYHYGVVLNTYNAKRPAWAIHAADTNYYKKFSVSIVRPSGAEGPMNGLLTEICQTMISASIDGKTDDTFGTINVGQEAVCNSLTYAVQSRLQNEPYSSYADQLSRMSGSIAVPNGGATSVPYIQIDSGLYDKI